MREVIFDTETTGLKPEEGERVIEIGAIELVDRIPTGRTFHKYINPGDQPISAGAFAVHGISAERLADEPLFTAIADEFIEFFAEGRLIAHNAPFDVGFLDAELARLERPPIDPDRVVDSLFLARRKFPGAQNTLDALCKRYGISIEHRTEHGALKDAVLLQQVYIELTGGLQIGLGFGEAAGKAASASDGSRPTQRKPARQRPAPLPDPATDSSRAAHAAMIERLGDEAVWKLWER